MRESPDARAGCLRARRRRRSASIAARAAAVGVRMVGRRPARPPLATVRLADPLDETRVGPDRTVVSVQGANVELPERLLDAHWTREVAEHLAGTYWEHLTEVFLGVIRGRSGPRGALVVLGARPLTLLAFGPPRVRFDPAAWSVRWPIEGGLLLAESRAGDDPFLEIAVARRRPSPIGPGGAHAAVTVSGYRPAIAAWGSPGFYMATQARVHVAVTHAYLRSLAWRLAAPPT